MFRYIRYTAYTYLFITLFIKINLLELTKILFFKNHIGIAKIF